jgi:hypothetical protein
MATGPSFVLSYPLLRPVINRRGIRESCDAVVYPRAQMKLDEIAIGFSILALTVSVCTLMLNYFVNVSRAEKANKVRYWMFAHEAVEFHRRWVLYATQILEKGMLSYSQPFDWISFGAVEEFLRVGGEKSVVEAVYRVKQLRFQADLQLTRTQREAEAQKAVLYGSPEPDAQTPEERLAHNAAVQAFKNNLKTVLGFILSEDEWPHVCRSIVHLIDRAEAHGHDVKDLRGRFERQKAEGDLRYNEWSDKIGR